MSDCFLPAYFVRSQQATHHSGWSLTEYQHDRIILCLENIILAGLCLQPSTLLAVSHLS